ncbi:hypothetical protein I546_0309 [Mycobacterium kansasii 732]|nr:hypothetical protein I546_0309 [Mycobacterium kansasii 732]
MPPGFPLVSTTYRDRHVFHGAALQPCELTPEQNSELTPEQNS